MSRTIPPFDSVQDAVMVMSQANRGTPEYARAAAFCWEHAPQEIRAAVHARRLELFPDLKPLYLTANGEPAFDVPTLAAYFGVTEESILSEASNFLELFDIDDDSIAHKEGARGHA